MSSPSRLELKRRSKDSKKLYCGDNEKLPKGYWNFGSRSQCTRQGVGIGMYVIPKQKEIERKSKSKEREKIKNKLRNKRRKTIDDLLEEEEIDNSDEEERKKNLTNKDKYKEFLDDNFKTVLKETPKNKLEIGELFKNLSVLWKIEQSLQKKNFVIRDKERKKEMKGKDY